MSESSPVASVTELQKPIVITKTKNDLQQDLTQNGVSLSETGLISSNESQSSLQDLSEEEEKKALQEIVEAYSKTASELGKNLDHAPTSTVLTTTGQKQVSTEQKPLQKVEIKAALKGALIPIEQLKDLQATMEKPQAQEQLQREQEELTTQMEPVIHRAFDPIVRPAERTGPWGKFKNRLKVGLRWAWATTLGRLISSAALLFTTPEKLRKEEGRIEKSQTARRHNEVPGRPGEYFAPISEMDINDDDEVFSDIRRGPLVWEKLSAGDPDAPPEVTIMVEQSKRGSGAALESMEMGHTMIGLSYSRYNKTTRRKERYNIQMGFYPKGGMVGTAGTVAMTGGAIMPGQLKDDTGHSYDIARRYVVKPGQINKILRAAENYEDRGYGYYKRNCSTFAVDMLRAAGIEAANEMQEDEMEFKGAVGLGLEIVEGTTAASYNAAANTISSRMKTDDLNYRTFGQKMVTAVDLQRYYDTALSADLLRKGYSPGALGETIRSSDKGQYSSRYSEDSGVTAADLSISMRDVGTQLSGEIYKLIPMVKRTDLDKEIENILTKHEDEGLSEAVMEETQAPADAFRNIHHKLSERIKKLDEYYKLRLGSDSRLNPLFMRYISICESAMSICDINYRKKVYRESPGDASFFRASYLYYGFDTIATTAAETEVKAKLSPGIYEGLLMAGLSPVQAITTYSKYAALDKKKSLSDSEKADHKRLKRYIDLASDFASANQYIMWKDVEEITEKDIQYAFYTLPAMERSFGQNENVKGAFFEGYGPSDVYKSAMFEKIFDGMKLDKDIMKHNMGTSARAAHIDKYLTAKGQASQSFVADIIKVMCDNKPNDDASGIAYDFIESMRSYFIPLFYDDDDILKQVKNIIGELNGASEFKSWLTAVARIYRPDPVYPQTDDPV